MNALAILATATKIPDKMLKSNIGLAALITSLLSKFGKRKCATAPRIATKKAPAIMAAGIIGEAV